MVLDREGKGDCFMFFGAAVLFHPHAFQVQAGMCGLCSTAVALSGVVAFLAPDCPCCGLELIALRTEPFAKYTMLPGLHCTAAAATELLCCNRI
jgi:hypothetical protein